MDSNTVLVSSITRMEAGTRGNGCRIGCKDGGDSTTSHKDWHMTDSGCKISSAARECSTISIRKYFQESSTSVTLIKWRSIGQNTRVRYVLNRLFSRGHETRKGEVIPV
jgi:hypothetical protein